MKEGEWSTDKWREEGGQLNLNNELSFCKASGAKSSTQNGILIDLKNISFENQQQIEWRKVPTFDTAENMSNHEL